MARLNWAVAPFARKGLVEFYSLWKEREGAHTRLGLETIKVSGIDLKWREVARTEEGSARGNVQAANGGEFAAGGLLRAVCSINGGQYGPCVPLATR